MMYHTLALAGTLAQQNPDAGGAAVAGFGIMYCCCMSFAILLGLGLMGFWIWMLVEAATKEPAEEPNKIVWVLVVVLTGWIGALIYFLARRPERKRKYGR
jgi:hypothetical protein